ncbi:MAG: hypothetical protein Q7R96_04475 [Nanoarchaeota archaeon]|nr:hypothetical protein [Nanoarchaeota archaeon]
MSNIGIIGYGIVGRATEHSFVAAPNLPQQHVFFRYDKFKALNSLNDVIDRAEFIFICLPTPYKEGKIDLSIIDEVLKEITPKTDNTNKVVIIKSSVVPGTTEQYSKQYPATKFCFSPEFLTEKNFLYDAVHPDRLVVGADQKDVGECVAALYRQRFPSVPLFIVSSKAAEMSKYMANLMLAAKVGLANEFFDACQVADIAYEDVCKVVAADPRIGGSHLQVTAERGFGGKCFPKDMIAFLGWCQEHEVVVDGLSALWERNLRTRQVYDWEDIPFVKS